MAITTNREGNMTLRQFKAKAVQVLRNAHPDATIGVEWSHAASVVWADGTRGFSGTLTVQAPGYRARTMHASFHDNGVWVR